MSQCVVPNWNLRHQQIEEEGEEVKKSSHVHRQHPNLLGLMANYEVTELTWENGQLAMHGLGGLVPNSPIKPIWTQALGDTLESIVHQATYHKENPNFIHYNENPINIDSVVASSGGKWSENSSKIQIMGPECMKKRSRSDSGTYQRHYCSSNVQEELGDQSACASASATFCRPENDTTMMTWTSFESPRSLKTRTTMDGDEDSAFRRELGNDPEEEERETKAETGRSHSIKRSRAADVHNQSERRRRDRINQKMKALQRLVPNSSKTDKASMLDEVIVYLKQLKAQIQMMSVRNMPQMMMPLGMQQQQLQMSLLARMGMTMGLGMGMGLFDVNTVGPTNPHPIPSLLHPNPMAAATTPTFVPPFLVPSMIPTHPTAPTNPDPVSTQPVSMNDPFYNFMAQSMNMDLYNQMTAELYRQQVNQKAQAMSNPLTGEPRPS